VDYPSLKAQVLDCPAPAVHLQENVRWPEFARKYEGTGDNVELEEAARKRVVLWYRCRRNWERYTLANAASFFYKKPRFYAAR